ncbi:serine hydrolase domain-containing protein [Hyphomonas sp. FCG-A18]|uniref:serine hydrolase domain-containing protein n=1 Tax=Hyphomonas sp. FCG-A18 TaxID=3080019 RepID=UPI002B2DD743|nr:serine hydrolase domain-containing protein [Hyphomonas sp. FCG-A18]
MIRVLVLSLVTLSAVVAWNISVFFATSEGWLKSPIVKSDSAPAFAAAAEEAVTDEHTGNLGMILIEDGEVAERYFMSTGTPVDGSSVYQVASLGKWITAWGVMVLVEEGAIDLDTPISEYLTRWQLPESAFDPSGVTVRRLLSHTAGLTDGLGYDGFERAEEVQSLVASLTRALDASPGNSGVVELGAEPGSEWNYSGGGYTILQLVIEEVSGQSFAEFMSQRVFVPLGMERSTFNHEEAIRLGLAQNFNLNGDTEPFRWYTALAATSLFTSADDLALFIKAQATPEGQSVLSGQSLELIRTPHASQMGADIWGLGAMLYAQNNDGGYIIGHDGNNGPAINTVARIDPATGDGIVILSTGSEMLATELAGEWVFWKTGNIDSLMFLMSFEAMLLWMGVGSLIIVILAIAFGWRGRRPRLH